MKLGPVDFIDGPRGQVRNGNLFGARRKVRVPRTATGLRARKSKNAPTDDKKPSTVSVARSPFTDNADGTVSDNVTGLMWQKVDNGESTWEHAVANAPALRSAATTTEHGAAHAGRVDQPR